MHDDGTEHDWRVYFIQDMGVWMPALTACRVCSLTSIDIVEAHAQLGIELPTVGMDLADVVGEDVEEGTPLH